MNKSPVDAATAPIRTGGIAKIRIIAAATKQLILAAAEEQADKVL